jgi:Pyruvate/2-oxoacid:ferredoxin oxidoreductase delta subunit/flavodoxin
MDTTIYYYTGTGNSLLVARTLARSLGDADVVSIAGRIEDGHPTGSTTVGLVFPVYIWGVPGRIVRFVGALKGFGQEYTFAVAVNGGQVANTLVQLEKILKDKGAALSAGFEITMPSNYIPWGGPGPERERNRRFESALAKISNIASCIKNRETRPVERGPLWQRLLFTPIYKLTFSKIASWDAQFWVDEKCSRCAICGKVCPSLNITLDKGKPVWNHRCEQCFACLQWCPQEAIQYGKKTPQYERYHHPEVRLKDVLKSRSVEEEGETPS